MPPTQFQSYDNTSLQAYQAASFLLHLDECTDREEQSTPSAVAIKQLKSGGLRGEPKRTFISSLVQSIKTHAHKNQQPNDAPGNLA